MGSEGFMLAHVGPSGVHVGPFWIKMGSWCVMVASSWVILEHLWATRTRRALTKAVTPPRVISGPSAVNLQGRLNPVLGLPKLKLKLEVWVKD